MSHDDDRKSLEQYAIVANRRLQWDTLLWQMPMMALTGEAFLLTIALYASTRQWGRILSAFLAFVVAASTLHSLGAHRLNELTDSAWLHEHEIGHDAERIHGLAWRERRSAMVAQQRRTGTFTDRVIARTAIVRSITLWFWTMALIALVSLGILAIAVFSPTVLGLR
jgi:hypothetical protein